MNSLKTDTILNCYTLKQFHKIKHTLIKISDQKNKNITHYYQFSFINNKLFKKLEHIKKLDGFKEILVFPNASNTNFQPKGTVLISNKLYPTPNLRLGRGCTVYLIKNIEPKLKKIKNCNIPLYDGYIEIHKINNYFTDDFKEYNYILIIRISLTNKIKSLYKKTIKQEPFSTKYSSSDEESNYLLNISNKLSEHCYNLRQKAAEIIFNKLNISEYKLFINQIESSIYKENNYFYHLSNIIKTEINNNTLICNLNDERTIYQKYYKGYKKIKDTINDLDKFNLCSTILEIYPIITFKL